MGFGGQGNIVKKKKSTKQQTQKKKQIDKSRLFMFVSLFSIQNIIYGEKLAETKSKIKCISIHILYIYLGSIHWFWKDLRQPFN